MPLLAVAKQIESTDTDGTYNIVAITEEGAEHDAVFDEYKTYHVWAGKYRRYYGESALERLTDFESLRLNIRDFFRFIRGFLQSYRILKSIHADIIFIKGGYVSLPVGLAAWLQGIPYVTHDSDSIPSLTNRILSKGAASRLSGFPHQNEEVKHVGIPIREEFLHTDYTTARKQLGIRLQDRYVVVMGGSLGAKNINTALLSILEPLTAIARVLHVSGRGHYETVKQQTLGAVNYELYDFIKLEKHFAAADVVVTRAGATALAELAALKKAAIVIPNPLLTDGHQLVNGEVIADNDAGLVLDEHEIIDNPNLLLEAINLILSDEKKQQWYGKNLNTVFPSNAAERIAQELENFISD